MVRGGVYERRVSAFLAGSRGKSLEGNGHRLLQSGGSQPTAGARRLPSCTSGRYSWRAARRPATAADRALASLLRPRSSHGRRRGGHRAYGGRRIALTDRRRRADHRSRRGCERPRAMTRKTVVIVSIDTEEDNWQPSRNGVAVGNIRELERPRGVVNSPGLRAPLPAKLSRA